MVRRLQELIVGDKHSKQEVLDFLITQEQLGVAFVSAAIEKTPGTPSEAFLPVLRNVVTAEYNHTEGLKNIGAKPLTTRYWLPDALFGDGGLGLFTTIEAVETIEVSMYLIGVSAFAHAGEEVGARLCAEAMGVEAVHRALARFAQGQLGKDVGPPNDVGFENFDYPTIQRVRSTFEEFGVGYGQESPQPGRFYEYLGDPVARGIGTPLNHPQPA
jgi:hypothetical protein